MIIRLVGLGLVACGLLAAALFLYVPLRDGTLPTLGFAGAKGFVFIPFAVVIGFALAAGGAPVLAAFQARPKSREQRTLIVLLLVISGALAGLGWWQLTRHFRRPTAPALLEPPPVPPRLPGQP